MLRGIDVNQTVDFVSVNDKDEPKTIFVLRPLTGLEVLDMSKYLEGQQVKLTSEYILDILGKTVTAIKNPQITEKSEIQKYVESLSPIVITELITKVSELSHITEQEAKNS